jgi:ADP-heptose:LPS heptosyltransferase
MTSESRPLSQVAIVLGGGVREALMAQPVVRACEGATVFATADASGTLIGLSSVGRTVVFDDSVAELMRVFRRLRNGPVATAVVPFPGRFIHAALVYFAGIPRRFIVAGRNDWAASEHFGKAPRLHPVEANWRLALAAGSRPLRAAGGPPRLEPSDAVRNQLVARWPAFFATGQHPLVLVPGAGGWSARHARPLWPAERYAVVANQSTADRVVVIAGAGDQRAARETRGSIVKPTLVIKLSDLTVEEMAVVSELSFAVIGHDSDALHVAAAAGALVLAVVAGTDIAPMGERVVTCPAENYERFPARRVLEALSAQTRVDSYA